MRRLSTTIRAPIAKIASAPTISAARLPNAGCWSDSPAIPLLPKGWLLLAADEAGRFHERDVPRFLLRHPVGVLLALEPREVERALLHQVLPLRGIEHLGEEAGVVVDVLLLDARRHEDAAQHEVVD